MSFPMRYPWIHVASDRQQEWLLKRNCSLAPRQLAVIFGGLALVSLSIATLFLLMQLTGRIRWSSADSRV